ncbi:MAG TPA: GMC family oxidoreductase N-terminal domain-containing protein [Steroidobacteraceae bacterium]|nr:GMC family oxidoreductase N-terminal domain-containing protein [Steroidobacteraceae bacterium]
MTEIFDYVVVGAGTAGCVLAARLSEDPALRVALLEAGPPDDDPAIHVPAMVGKAIGNPRNGWGYTTTPQIHADNRVLPVPRGRVLGGCSSINGMVYFRGHPREYDEWNIPGWRWQDLKPYFLKLENYQAAHTPERARGGPVNVIDIPRPNPLVKRFLAATDSLGLPRCADFNGGDPEGFGPRQGAIRDGRRESAVTAYLDAARQRPNLTVLTDAPATRVMVADGRATGVEVEHSGVRRVISAAREVIVSCGAYGSPQLLQLSGIGDASLLRQHGIDVVLDLPAVGRNLHDHPASSVSMRTHNTESYGLSWRTLPRSAWIAAQYLLARRGPLASNVFEANGFMRSQPDLDRPDLQIIFMPAHRNANGHWLPRGHGYGVIFVNLRPASRGSVRITSNDPFAKPAIDFNFLADSRDLDVLVRGFEVARQVLGADSFAKLGSWEISPGAETRDRAAIEAHIRRTLVTVHHPCGTCRIGDVVDEQLRVKGIAALRIVDASVIPTVISGNSNIPVNAVAERGADLIRGRAA